MEYGCIGEHLTHSFSKEIHSYFADYTYTLKELNREEISDFFKTKNFKAINVTIPYKEKVIDYLDDIDSVAKEIGAVNTVVNENGKLLGYNTDFFGLKSLIEVNSIEIKGKKVLILGNGGTAKTANAVCKSLMAKEVLTVSRTKSDNVITYDEAYSLYNDFEIIINTTPCGMFPSCEGYAIDPRRFPKLQAVIDVVYNPLKTDLLKLAEEMKIKACGGLYMLVAQAAFAVSKFINKNISDKMIYDVYKDLLLKKKNIVLVGMPSSGKSYNGKKIASYLNRDFYDSDTLIEENEKMPIKDIFKQKGEKYFRDVESFVINELSKKSGVVLATGGGVVLRKENIDNLKKNSYIFFIDRSFNQLICTDSRPLSSNKNDLELLFQQRYPIYLSCADFILKSDNVFDEFVDLYREI